MLDFLQTVIFITKILVLKEICISKPISTIFRGYQTFTYVKKQFLALWMDSDIQNIRS